MVPPMSTTDSLYGWHRESLVLVNNAFSSMLFRFTICLSSLLITKYLHDIKHGFETDSLSGVY